MIACTFAGLCVFAGGSIRQKIDVIFSTFDLNNDKVLDESELMVMFGVIFRVGQLKLELQASQLDKELLLGSTALAPKTAPPVSTASPPVSPASGNTQYLRAGKLLMAQHADNLDFVGGVTGALNALFTETDFFQGNKDTTRALCIESVQFFCSRTSQPPTVLVNAIKALDNDRFTKFWLRLRPIFVLPGQLHQFDLLKASVQTRSKRHIV